MSATFFDTNVLVYATLDQDVAKNRFSPFVTVADTPYLVLRALDLRRDHDLQFFDALIVAGAEFASCDTLYSEDMSDGERYGAVDVVNPFKALSS